MGGWVSGWVGVRWMWGREIEVELVPACADSCISCTSTAASGGAHDAVDTLGCPHVGTFTATPPERDSQPWRLSPCIGLHPRGAASSQQQSAGQIQPWKGPLRVSVPDDAVVGGKGGNGHNASGGKDGRRLVRQLLALPLLPPSLQPLLAKANPSATGRATRHGLFSRDGAGRRQQGE